MIKKKKKKEDYYGQTTHPSEANQSAKALDLQPIDQ